LTAALIALRLLTIQYIHVSYLCRYFMQIRYVTYIWVYVLYYNIFCFMQLSRAEDGPSELTDDVLLPQMVEDPDADSRDKDEFLLVEEADERAFRRRGRRFGRPNCAAPFIPLVSDLSPSASVLGAVSSSATVRVDSDRSDDFPTPASDPAAIFTTM
jgi:hypothetical protein